jgi:hypothetical protein
LGGASGAIFKVTSGILGVRWLILALQALFSASCRYFWRATAILGVTGSIFGVPALFFEILVNQWRIQCYLRC